MNRSTGRPARPRARRERRSTPLRNHRVAPAVLAALAVVAAAATGCSGSTGEAAPTTTTAPPRYRASGPGADPAPGGTVDAGATTVTRSPSGRVRLATVSSRAGFVSGGDTLVEIRVTDRDGRVDPHATVRLSVDDRAVTDVPAPDDDGRIRHLVTGLGATATVTASVGDDATDRAGLTVTDHPANGPLLAGPKLTPFVCRNEVAGLPPATDEDCSTPTTYTWTYRGRDGAFHDLADPAAVPADADTTTVDGRTVPYVVRDETGVIDRSIYHIQVLDPRAGTGPAPAWRPDGWNRRIVHRFGGGCGSTYSNHTGFNMAANPDFLLRRGYAVVSSTLTTFQALCNPTISAEVTALLREHFIEHYGVPDFAIGDGGSGGAIQQLAIAANYPGLLDAVTPSMPFPDAVSISGGVTDCGLLINERDGGTGPALSEEQWTAVSGFATFATCRLWKRLFLENIDPTDGCDPLLADRVYDAVTRPGGVRCTSADSNINVWGRDPATGFARRPLDNTGIEYGRAALQAGTITVDQFLDLNEHIGGFDIDGVVRPARTAADDESIGTAYRTGGVLSADLRPLADVPVLFLNPYSDPEGDIHDSFRAFSLRDRLTAAGLSTANTMVHTDLRPATSPDPWLVPLADQWLTAAARTPADRPWSERLTAARPVEAVDECTIGTELVRGADVYAPGGRCVATYPHHGDPRTAAGAPERDDILKCAHRPVDDEVVRAHGVAFTPGQRARLAAIFPDGVCDWTRPGPGTAAGGGPWQRY